MLSGSDAVVSPELNAVAPKIATSTSNKTDLDGITLTGVSLSFLQRLRAGAVKKRAAAGPLSDTRTACNALGKQLRAPRREGEPLTTGDVAQSFTPVRRRGLAKALSPYEI